MGALAKGVLGKSLLAASGAVRGDFWPRLVTCQER